MKNLWILALVLFAVGAQAADLGVANGVFNADGVKYGLMVKVDASEIYNETYYLYSTDDVGAFQAAVSYVNYDFSITSWKYTVGFGTGIINQFRDGKDSRGVAYKTSVGYNLDWKVKFDLSFHYFPANEDMWYLGIGITRL